MENETYVITLFVHFSRYDKQNIKRYIFSHIFSELYVFGSLQLKVSNMSEEPAIYDSIVKEYSNAKTNPYKSYIEEPTFWRCLGNISGKSVLDLACGSGYYSR